MYENPRIRSMYDKTEIKLEESWVTVRLLWKGVDRPCCDVFMLTFERHGGKEGAMAMAQRLKKAAESGALFMHANEREDYRGKSYIDAPTRLSWRLDMGPQLAKLGY